MHFESSFGSLLFVCVEITNEMWRGKKNTKKKESFDNDIDEWWRTMLIIIYLIVYFGNILHHHMKFYYLKISQVISQDDIQKLRTLSLTHHAKTHRQKEDDGEDGSKTDTFTFSLDSLWAFGFSTIKFSSSDESFMHSAFCFAFFFHVIRTSPWAASSTPCCNSCFFVCMHNMYFSTCVLSGYFPYLFERINYEVVALGLFSVLCFLSLCTNSINKFELL